MRVNNKLTFILTAILIGVSPSISEVIISPYGGSVSLDNDDVVSTDVTFTNSSDQDVNFKITFDDPPDDDERGQGPHRDDPPDGAFAIFQDQRAWGFYGDWFEQRIEDIDVQVFRQAGDLVDVDLADFD